MRSVSLNQMVTYCDRLLRIGEIGDYDGAANGLQVENSGTITRIAAAVDASLATIELAKASNANLLLVHHGLFWTKSHPWTGHRYQLIRSLLRNDIAVYSAHLPLDVHPRFGNNARLCATLRLNRLRPFFPSHGQPIGFKSSAKISRNELARRLQLALGRTPHMIPAGPEQCRCIGVVTGGAGGELRLASAGGVDTFITGEGPHWTYALAEELGINVFYGGHYATETFGVKALARHLSERFRVPWQFLDHPTGL